MRHLLAATLLAGTVLLAGCGDGSDSTATDPTGQSSSPAPSSASASPSPTSTVEPVSIRKTCKALYYTPHQWMQHAIAVVRGKESDKGPTAAEIVAGLAAVKAEAAPQLVDDLEITRAGVAAAAAGQDVDKTAFFQAGNRLADHCELYLD
ncbi:hypothetical protein [Nocardioides sp.]|uniref:hypothetical protein n=1 Tax=Nocardioides sp. TaxID=35761 RepID=UPI003782F2A7